MGQAIHARPGRFAAGHGASQFPEAYAVTYKTAGPPQAAAPVADSIPAADRRAAPDADADELAHHHLTDLHA